MLNKTGFETDFPGTRLVLLSGCTWFKVLFNTAGIVLHVLSRYNLKNEMWICFIY